MRFFRRNQKVFLSRTSCLSGWMLWLLGGILLAGLFLPPKAYAALRVQQETLAEGTQFATTLYILDSGKAGDTVWVSGGVHGNEPAGYKAAEKLLETEISCGKLIILPRANEIAIQKKLRSPAATGNLNRKFPTSANGKAESTLAKAILAAMKKYEVDWVVDLHEGANYSQLASSTSVGQSVIYYPSGQAKKAAEKITAALNQGIKTDYRQFQILRYPAKGSLARAGALVCGADSMIVETCCRDKLETRVNRQVKAVHTVLELAGMK